MCQTRSNETRKGAHDTVVVSFTTTAIAYRHLRNARRSQSGKDLLAVKRLIGRRSTTQVENDKTRPYKIVKPPTATPGSGDGKLFALAGLGRLLAEDEETA